MDGFDPLEATVGAFHDALAAGTTTSASLVAWYLDRIDAYDETLQAILTVNDAARDRARELDEAYAQNGLVGPLHGVPIVVKDNYATGDLPTTAGSTVLRDAHPPRDAPTVAALRDAGAIVLAKTNLQELSFGVDTISSLGGATRNAYDTTRRPSGSSGGTAAALAANLGLVGTGTDTCSSVRSPPAFHALVGVRPTRGLVSRSGIVPLSETQDTAGPITRTVADAARTLDVMAGYDPDDPVTARGVGRTPDGGYLAALADHELDDARIGVARSLFGPRADAASASIEEGTDDDNTGGDRTEAAARVTTVIDDALDTLADRGATLVDPVSVPDVDRLESARVMDCEWARDFAAYCEAWDAPIDSLAEWVAAGELPDSIAERVEAAGVLDVDPDGVASDTGYLRRLRRRDAVRDETLAVMAEHSLDAICYPPSRIPPVELPTHQPFTELNCELAAYTGLPAVTVPAGFTDDGLPVGLEVLGRAFDEARLLGLAESVERVVDARDPPERFGPLCET